MYPCTVTDHCEDGTVLVKYMHESPVHEEYVKPHSLQVPIRIARDNEQGSDA